MNTHRLRDDKLIVKYRPYKAKKGSGGLVDYNNLPPKKILGYKLFPHLYSNIFLNAQTNSGKTVVIQHILDHCADKFTQVIFFVPTFDIDPQYQSIKQMLRNKGISYINYDHFKEGGENHIQNLLEVFQEEHKPEDSEDEEEEEEHNKRDLLYKHISGELEEKEEKKVKVKKRKKISPEYIIVCDDLGDGLRNRAISELCKKNRHYKMKVILSSQYWKDLTPACIANLYYVILFKNLDSEILKTTYNKLRPPHISLDKFIEMYNFATKDPYSFLYINKKTFEYRKNFNELIYL